MAVQYAALVVVGYLNARARDPWVMGDWVINYEGGFVRRGLIGEVSMVLSRFSHQPVFYVVLIEQLGLYAVAFFAAYRLLARASASVWTILLLCNPATLSFGLFNPSHAFHKEIIFYVLLAGSALWRLSARRSEHARVAAATLGLGVLLLSHEGFFAFVPYLIAIFLIADGKRGLVPSLLISVVAIGAVAISVMNRGSTAIAEDVCRSVGGRGLEEQGICNGAIISLTYSVHHAHGWVIELARHRFPLATYPIVLCASLVPVAATVRRLVRSMKNEMVIFGICAGCAWLASSLLFYYSVDWDRWIHIHAMSAAVVLVFTDALGCQGPPRRNETLGGVSVLHIETTRPMLAALLTLAYLTGWQCAFYHHFPIPERLARYVWDGVRGTSVSAPPMRLATD
jgi:hypothetical protein